MKVYKKILLINICLIFFAGCASLDGGRPRPAPHEIIVKIKAADPTKVEVVKSNTNLSNLTFIVKDVAISKIFSTITVSDVTRFWSDILVLKKSTDIRKIHLLINSPGGDAYSGLALADQIEGAIKDSFQITCYASGLVASAAVPIFAACNKRIANPATLFMIHETSLYKWPGRESASDIRSQGKLINLLRDQYIGKLAKNSKLSKEQWGALENKTTWFSAEQAKEWGLVDKIE